MSMRHTEGVSIMQALAMTVAEIPVFLYSTFGQSIFSQLRLTPSLKKVLFATALGSVALALTAHHLKRRSRKRKQIAEKAAPKTVGIPEQLLRSGRPTTLKKGPYPGRQMLSPSTRSNDTMSGISSLAASKHSSSSHTSGRLPASPNQSAPVASTWEVETVAEEPGAIEDANAENLYIMGMELFEEALQKWEQALNIRHQSQSNSSANSLARQGAALTPETRNRKFAEKLETLLHQAYHLQEDFGSTIPADSLLADLESEGTLILPVVESSHGVQDDDAATITSDDSFFSAAELFDTFTLDEVYQPLKPAALYEEAVSLVRDGKVDCRSLRTELLECYSDQDFLAKLHCVRQAFHVLLMDEAHKNFFMETGKQMISGLMIKANKSPKAFLESYQDMLLYTQREETWPTTKMELEGRGVVCMNFFDIVLDFILMDAFEDLENPPTSVVAVLRNRWLSDSFKETALATACWSVLKAKRRLLMVPDGFISHFYAISEHVGKHGRTQGRVFVLKEGNMGLHTILFRYGIYKGAWTLTNIKFNTSPCCVWSSSETYRVLHDRQRRRFTLTLNTGGGGGGAQSAVLHYSIRREGHVDLLSTEVPESFRGRGVGASLAKAALDFVVEENLKARISCWYIKKYVDENPQHGYQMHIEE